MKIVCVSDTHGRYDSDPISLPKGDMLIHAGDATFRGNIQEISEFNLWFKSQKFKHKILIAGNHDWLFQTNQSLTKSLLDKSITYLEDSLVEIEGLKIYGSPWQPEFGQWAFNLPRGNPLQEKWDMIPSGLDILVTHGPPYGKLDKTAGMVYDYPDGTSLSVQGDHVGDTNLKSVVDKVKPKYHIFGHIHSGHGISKTKDTVFINAAICDEHYDHTNSAIVIDTKTGEVK